MINDITKITEDDVRNFYNEQNNIEKTDRYYGDVINYYWEDKSRVQTANIKDLKSILVLGYTLDSKFIYKTYDELPETTRNDIRDNIDRSNRVPDEKIKQEMNNRVENYGKTQLETVTVVAKTTQKKEKPTMANKYDKHLYANIFKANVINDKGFSESPEKDESSITSDFTSKLRFAFPTWGIDDFIVEKSNFQKGITSLTGEPGFFYFKVFFDFNTSFGLLGQILNYDPKTVLQTNTAMKYMLISNKLYVAERMEDRIVALYKFVNMLSFISCKTPWFFKSISGLDEAAKLNLTSVQDDKQEIQLEFSEDAVDMRLNTMSELYRLACFDTINQKEIIPENLRKFDMSIMVFHTPLKYYQTAIQSRSLKMNIGYKQVVDKMLDDEPKIRAKENELKLDLSRAEQEQRATQSTGNRQIKSVPNNGNGQKPAEQPKAKAPDTADDSKNTDTPTDTPQRDVNNTENTSGSKIKADEILSMWANSFSYKMYTFHNCEFDMDSFASLTSELKNESAQNIGGTKLKIRYTRCYIHTMNEWFNMMFGPDGFYYNDVNSRLISEQFFNKLRARNAAKDAMANDNITNTINMNSASESQININNNWLGLTEQPQQAKLNSQSTSDGLDNLYLLNDDFNSASPNARRLNAISKARSSVNYYNVDAGQYKELIDATEMMITDNFRQINGSVGLGNLYNDPNLEVYTSPDATYFKEKMHKLKMGTRYQPGEINNGNKSNWQTKIGLWWNGLFNSKMYEGKTEPDSSPFPNPRANDWSFYDNYILNYVDDTGLKFAPNNQTVGALPNIMPGRGAKYNMARSMGKAKQLKRGTPQGNLYNDNHDRIYDHSGNSEQFITNPKSDYFKNKVASLRNGQKQGNIYNDGDLIYDHKQFGELGPTNKDSQYFKDKIKKLHSHNPHKFDDEDSNNK